MTYAEGIAAILADNPWGMWAQEEVAGSTLADTSGHGRPMTLTGAGITLAQPGPHGAMSVNYASAVSTNNAKTAAVAPGIHATSAATIEVWLFVSNPSTNTINDTPVFCHQAADGSGSNDKNLTIRSLGGADHRLTWHVHNGALREITATVSPAGGGEWFHVIASVGAAGQKLRVNGVTVAHDPSVVSSYTTKSQRSQLHACDIGRGAPGNGPVRVALPAFWTRQLSDAETDAHRAALMAVPVPVGPPLYVGSDDVSALYLGESPADNVFLG